MRNSAERDKSGSIPGSGPSPTCPMAGLRVLDFSIMIAGPYATRMMADLGAEVIKVESPEGDSMRHSPPIRDGHSAYFTHLNAGKSSVVLDLKQPAGRDAALELASRSDIVVQNFRPAVMDRLGLGYAAMSERNPGIVYCSISGYGQTGPDADRPAFAMILHAASGMDLAMMGHQEADRPPATGIFTADVLSALYALIAVQGALAVRNATGRGQHLDVTLFESMLNLMPFEVQEAQFPLPEPRPVYKPIRARDGFLMVVVITQGNFENLCAAIDRPDLRNDRRFCETRARSANRVALMAEVESWTLQRDAQDCENRLSAAGVPCSRYRTVRENLSNASLLERGSFAEVGDAAGTTRVPNLPYMTGSTRPQVGARAPELGADTERILGEVGGLSPAHIEELRTYRTTG